MSILVRLEYWAIEAAWPRIERWVELACKKSHGRYTPQLVKGWAQQNLWQIWMAVDDTGVIAVAGTEMLTYQTGLKVIGIRFGVGRNRRKWQHHMDAICEWGKSQGCALAEGDFRVGWRRIFRKDWRHTHEFLERVL